MLNHCSVCGIELYASPKTSAGFSLHLHADAHYNLLVLYSFLIHRTRIGKLLQKLRIYFVEKTIKYLIKSRITQYCSIFNDNDLTAVDRPLLFLSSVSNKPNEVFTFKLTAGHKSTSWQSTDYSPFFYVYWASCVSAWMDVSKYFSVFVNHHDLCSLSSKLVCLTWPVVLLFVRTCKCIYGRTMDEKMEH